jgi:hypothetical protein
MRFHFIADHCEQFEVTVMCRVLEVSRSGYYAWRKRPTSEREMADQALTEQIKVIYGKSQGTYGSPRIQAELAAEGVKVSRKRVARLMRQADLRGDDQGQTFKVVTTDANHDYPIAPNLLAQAFEAERPDQVWLADRRPFGRLVNISWDMTHQQGWVSSLWRSGEPSNPRLVSFQGKCASCAGETDPQNANVPERMGWG